MTNKKEKDNNTKGKEKNKIFNQSYNPKTLLLSFRFVNFFLDQGTF